MFFSACLLIEVWGVQRLRFFALVCSINEIIRHAVSCHFLLLFQQQCMSVLNALCLHQSFIWLNFKHIANLRVQNNISL